MNTRSITADAANSILSRALASEQAAYAAYRSDDTRTLFSTPNRSRLNAAQDRYTTVVKIFRASRTLVLLCRTDGPGYCVKEIACDRT